MADYRYLVADLLTNTIREEIPFSRVSYGRVLCRAGSARASIPYTHPKATFANLEPKRTALFIERDGQIVWGGIIWTARRSENATTVDIGAEGFWSYFKRRRVRWNLVFTAADQLTIAKTIIDRCQDAGYSPGGNIGVLTDTTTCGVLRDRTYNAYERKLASDAVEQLAALQNGFDFGITCQWESGVITKRLHWNYPQRGVRSGLVFELGANVQAIGWLLDGTHDANSVTSIGAGEGASMLIASSSDTSQLAVYPLLEDVTSYKDVTSTATLAAHAQADLAARNGTSGLSNLVARLTDDVTVGSWTEGDQVYVRAHDGFVDFEGWYRIVQDEIDVDDQGYETAKLTFAGVENF